MKLCCVYTTVIIELSHKPESWFSSLFVYYIERFMIWKYYHVSEMFLKVIDIVKIQKSGKTLNTIETHWKVGWPSEMGQSGEYPRAGRARRAEGEEH